MQALTSTRVEDDRTVVSVSGELDLCSAPRLQAHLADAGADDQPVVVLDLRDVTFVDSVGLGVIVSAFKRIRAAGGSLLLVATGDAVLRVLRVTGLHELLPAFATVSAALEAARLRHPARR